MRDGEGTDRHHKELQCNRWRSQRCDNFSKDESVRCDFPLTSPAPHRRLQITRRELSLLNQQPGECQEANTLSATVRLPRDYCKPPRWVTVTVTVVGVRIFRSSHATLRLSTGEQ